MKRFVIAALLFTFALVILCGCNNERAMWQAKTPMQSAEYEGHHYQTAVEDFAKRGFTNIKIEPVTSNELSDIDREGNVVEVLVDGNGDYQAENWYHADVEIVIKYQSFSFDDFEEPSPYEDFEPANFARFVNGEYDRTNLYLKATICDVSNQDELTLMDSKGNIWKINLYSEYNFIEYSGKECEVFASVFKSGTASGFPQLVLTADNHKAVFNDGKIVALDTSADMGFAPKDKAYYQTDIVWISTKRGTKYHSKSNCSGMKDAVKIDRPTAEINSFEPCSRCE